MPWQKELVGRIDRHVVSSRSLAGNALGDPADRPLWVYVPPGYDDDPARRYPSVYVLQGYTGQVSMWSNRSAYRLPFPEAADELFARGQAPPCLVVYVDAWTAYGGSQFVDSPGTGLYHSYLCNDVVPFVDDRYRTLDDPRHRGIQGKSSGGFGAMITPMLRPDLFGGFASHAGDALYESLYIPEFAKAGPGPFATTGGPSGNGGRNSGTGSPSLNRSMKRCSWCSALQRVSRLRPAGPRCCRSTPIRAACARRSGNGGWLGIRSVWSRSMLWHSEG